MKAKGMQNRRLLATTTFLALAAALLLVGAGPSVAARATPWAAPPDNQTPGC
jgi:hypothetical protein